MSEETDRTSESPESAPSPEPSAQPTTPATPTPPDAASGEPQAPEWLNAPLTDGGYSGGPNYAMAPPYVPPPQYQPPPPQYQPPYAPPPPQQRPGISLEDLGRNPDGSIRNLAREEVMQAVGPLLEQVRHQQERLAVLDTFGKRQHEASVVRGFEQARDTVRNTYENVYAKDPAFRNKAVQQRVDQMTRMYLAEQVARAYQGGDFSGLQVAQTARPYRLILAAAKEDAGWSDSSGRLDMRGAFVESSRSQPQSSFSLNEDEREAARILKMSDEDFWKAKEESRKRGGGL
jgi:hypothetical protein